MVGRRVSSALCIHGHFYQPPRENPWTGKVEEQPSAAPFHDWNERITHECYRANAAAAIYGADGQPERTINNYAHMSFDFGPTLLRYLAEHKPEVYQAVLAADREGVARFGGHGPAIAQSYSHAILPLCSERDRRTEIRWGLRHFELRFGRKSEGMWLPEAAVDTPTLEALAAEGVRFTILAQRQAAQVRSMQAITPLSKPRTRKKPDHVFGEWLNVGATSGVLDTRRPYLVRLPSGASIAVFFYDGGLAHDVAFGGALSNGEAFLKALEQNAPTPFSGGEPLPTGKTAFAGRLVHLATDGETFGHHHQFADIGLAWILDSAAAGRSELALTVYGQWLEQHPPTMEARLHERSSWSCIHGVERWRSNCGCHGGRRSNGTQAWRGPLREALDDLRDHLATVFERESDGLLHDPWKARDEYVEPLTMPRRDKKFFAEHTIKWHILRRVHRAFELLEMQRHTLHMYASCAWFFDDVSDIEALQGMAHAACAIDYAGKPGADIERRFLAILAQVRSNDGDTADTLYRRVVHERRPKWRDRR